MTTALAKRNCSEEQWQVLAVRARSFRWASAFLSGPQRRRVAALYAFCRAVDDLADAEQASPEARAELLALYRALDDESTEGREARWPDSYLWFQALCLECGIDFGVVRELLRGMMGDLATVRFETDRELLRYCYRAAGTVGLMMCSVLGVVDRRAQRHAVDLGIAMQLTNICRDVLEDAQAARVYLPAERLAQYGVTSEQLVEGSADELGVSLVVNDLLDVAEVSTAASGDGFAESTGATRFVVGSSCLGGPKSAGCSRRPSVGSAWPSSARARRFPASSFVATSTAFLTRARPSRKTSRTAFRSRPVAARWGLM